jgi:hypothetical protein
MLTRNFLFYKYESVFINRALNFVSCFTFHYNILSFQLKVNWLNLKVK